MNYPSIWHRLGLESEADERSIKRAYAVKLREVHPEDDPEGFQELRAAYEHALAWARAPRPDIRKDQAGGSSPAVEATATTAVEDERAAQPGPWDSPVERLKQPMVAAAFGASADPTGSLATFQQFLAGFAQLNLIEEVALQQWSAELLAHAIPNSDPLIYPAIEHFGWDRNESSPEPAVAALIQRANELDTVAKLANPREFLNGGWKALTRPPRSPWLLRLKCFFTNLPVDVVRIRHIQLNGLNGIGHAFDKDAFEWWSKYLSKARLRWTTLLAAVPWLAVWIALLAYAVPRNADAYVLVATLLILLSPAVPFAYLYARRCGAILQERESPWLKRLTVFWLTCAGLLPLGAAALVHGPAAAVGLCLAIGGATLALIATTEQGSVNRFSDRLIDTLRSTWPTWLLVWIFGIAIEPPLIFAFVALSLFMLLVQTRGFTITAEVYLRYVRRWQALIAAGAGITLFLVAIGIGWAFPASSAFAMGCCALLALTLMILGIGLSPGRAGPIVARFVWIAFLILAGHAMSQSGQSNSSAPATRSSVPLADQPRMPESSIITVFGARVAAAELQKNDPELYALFQTDWQLATEQNTTADFAENMGKVVDARIGGTVAAFDPTMLRSYWTLERDIERELMDKHAIDACVSRIEGGTGLENLPAPIQREAAALRARYDEAGYSKLPAQARARGSVMIPGDVVLAGARSAGLSMTAFRTALAGGSTREDRCRMHVGLISALLKAPKSTSEPILRKL